MRSEVEGPGGLRIDRGDALPLALMLCVWVAVVTGLLMTGQGGDLQRFVQIAHGGTPYVDQQVEYPPLATLAITAIGAGTLSLVVVLTACLNATATLTCWRLLRHHWSVEVGHLFLWFALPLQIFMPVRLDAIPVTLAVAALVLSDREREATGGVLFAAAILFRVWPLALLPMLWLKGHRRAFLVCLVSVAIGAAVWIAGFGIDAVWQVVTFRGATGWHIETPVGIVLLAEAGGSFVQDAGAARVGRMLRSETWALGVASLCAIALAWSLAWRRAVDLAGAPALAAIASLLVLSPVASPQYVAWLLPWAAILAAERRPLGVQIATVTAGGAAAGMFAAYWGSRFELWAFVLLVGVRIVAITALGVIGFSHRGAEQPRREDPGTDGGAAEDSAFLAGAS